MEKVILVDEQDQAVGHMEKMEAHRKGALHRAFSVFIFNDQGEMLIHRRALEKYHSGGLWTNACCSHPREGESTEEAAHRRLKEEMGFDCALQEQFSFIYRAVLDNGLTEHELDHVFVGRFNGKPIPHPEEVSEWRFVSLARLERDIMLRPYAYTVWFKIALDELNSNKMAVLS
ncbi:MAG: isopentenyl-diphosphate Delta-isomerase [Cryomorphaceae bacterium]